MGVYSGNRTLLGESMEVDNTGHVLDFVIECERNELKLFDAVLGCDMIQAYTEAGLTTLTLNEAEEAEETSEKSLGKKIKELFEKAVAAVKRFVATFIAKVQNFFANDAKLLKEYGKNFSANGVGYKLKFDWKVPSYDIFDKPEEVLNRIADNAGDKEFETVKKNIYTGSSTDVIDKEVEKYKKKIKDIDVYKNLEKILYASDKAEENYTLDSQDVKEIFRVMASSTRSINAVKRYGNYLIKELKQKQNDVKSLSKITEVDLTLARLNGVYKVSSMYIKVLQKSLNATLSGMTRVLATCRKVFVSAGKNATEKKATNEATVLYDNLLAEASDIYVMQALDMAM